MNRVPTPGIGTRFIAALIRRQEGNAAFDTERHQLRGSNSRCCDHHEEEQNLFFHVKLARHVPRHRDAV